MAAASTASTESAFTETAKSREAVVATFGSGAKVAVCKPLFQPAILARMEMLTGVWLLKLLRLGVCILIGPAFRTDTPSPLAVMCIVQVFTRPHDLLYTVLVTIHHAPMTRIRGHL